MAVVGHGTRGADIEGLPVYLVAAKAPEIRSRLHFAPRQGGFMAVPWELFSSQAGGSGPLSMAQLGVSRSLSIGMSCALRRAADSTRCDEGLSTASPDG